MKKISISLFLAALLTTAVNAQDPRPRLPGHPPRMHEKLNLTGEQKQKMKSQQEDFRKKMMDLRKNEEITVKEWKSRMQALQKKHREDMQSLLSSDQKAHIEKMKLERKQMAEINARSRMEKMKLRLSLDKEQTDKLETQRNELMQKMKSLHENTALDRQKKREEMQQLMKNHREQLKSILTEEQLKKTEEMKKHHPRKRGRLS